MATGDRNRRDEKRNGATAADLAEHRESVASTYEHTGLYHGVCVVDGWGAKVRVEKGHLEVSDGLGEHRRVRRYSKVRNQLSRLLVPATTGTITLDALRWCQGVGVAVMVLDAGGQPSFGTTGGGVDDARLRRAQALAAGTDVGRALAVELLTAKLGGQAAILDDRLDAPDAAEEVLILAGLLDSTVDVVEARQIEARAAVIYWQAWNGHRATSVRFPTRDRARIPDHWTTYDGRRSPLQPTGNRLAADPVNALLNYLYRLAEIEAHQAIQAVGLDPGLGILHADTPNRDSVVLDLIEPVRPVIDRTVLDLLAKRVFRKVDFAETRSGIVRVLAPLSHELTATMGRWAAEVAPWAEHAARAIAASTGRPIRQTTRLTGTKRRAAQTGTQALQRAEAERRAGAKLGVRPRTPAAPLAAVTIPHRCEGCGAALDHHQRRWCPSCWPSKRTEAGAHGTAAAREQLTDPAARLARSAAVAKGKATAKAERLHSLGFTLDDWPRIVAGLHGVTSERIAAATGLSTTAAYRISTGVRVPGARHWPALSNLAKQTASDNET